MKKILLILAAATMLAACNKNEPEFTPNQDKTAFNEATKFEASGTNNVPDGDGPNTPFEMKDIRSEVVIVNETTLDIYLYEVAFASAMAQRTTINMVIPGVNYIRTEGQITLSGDNITPTTGGNPFTRYIVYNLSGTITADSLKFTNSYGTYSGCTYAGKITQMSKAE